MNIDGSGAPRLDARGRTDEDPSWSPEISVATGIEAPDFSNPNSFNLSQNYPNPFNPSTRITFTVSGRSQNVRLKVYNITGKKVRTLVDGELQFGQYTFEWNGMDDASRALASGVYWYRLTNW